MSGFDGNEYLKRLADRECPVPYDSPILLPPRPAPPAPLDSSSPLPRSSHFTVYSPEEKELLTSLYYTNAALPPSQRFSSFSPDSITTIIPGAAWVLKLLTPEECEYVKESGEQFGLHGPKQAEALGEPTGARRTMKRTNDFMFPAMSTLVGGKLPEELLDLVEASSPHTSVRGLHPNWRVAKYEPGDAFPAHYDNSDTITVIAKDGSKEKLTSSHTLLVYLSDRSSYGGGATRLFPQGRYDKGVVDVELPQGFALLFQQKGMLHAGLAVEEGAKYITQAGLLRGQYDVKPGMAPSIFRYGPGLDHY